MAYWQTFQVVRGPYSVYFACALILKLGRHYIIKDIVASQGAFSEVIIPLRVRPALALSWLVNNHVFRVDDKRTVPITSTIEKMPIEAL